MPSVKSHQRSSRISDRYDGSPKKFHAVLRRLYQYVLRKKLYFWRGKVMTYHNCPIKMRLILTDSIRYKWILDSLLRKNLVLKAFRIDKKTTPTISMEDICIYFGKKKDRQQEQTQKLLQIIHDFRQELPHILRRECFGQESFDKVLVKYLNKQYENILGQNKFTQEIDQDSNVEKLLELYDERIMSREDWENKEYMLKHTEQEIKKIQEEERQFWYQFKSYRQDEEFSQFQSQPRHQLTQLQKINFMLKFRFHLEDYLWDYDQHNKFQKKDKHKFLPRNITTEILKRQQEERIERLRREEQDNENVSCSQCDYSGEEANSQAITKRVKLIKKQKKQQQQQKTQSKRVTSKPYEFLKPTRTLLKQADENYYEYSPILSPQSPTIPDFFRFQRNQDDLRWHNSSSDEEFSSISLFSKKSQKKLKKKEPSSNGRFENTGNSNYLPSLWLDLPGETPAHLYY